MTNLRAQHNIKDAGGLLAAGYMISVLLYGLWAMANHIHWAVPFFLVGLAIVSQKAWLAVCNGVAAVVFAVYGLSASQHLHWFKATLLLLVPLVVLHVLEAVIMAQLRKRSAQAADSTASR